MEIIKNKYSVTLNAKLTTARATDISIEIKLERKYQERHDAKIYIYKYNRYNNDFLYSTECDSFYAFDHEHDLKDEELEEVKKHIILLGDAVRYIDDGQKWAEEKDALIYSVTYNPDKKVTSLELSSDYNIKALTELLYNKYIAKAQYIKQIQYQYNYTDKQTLTVIYSNGWRQVFVNIPTSLGILKLDKWR